MIKLRSLDIQNYGPIENFTMTLDGRAGTYSISAPNGSGKSHIVTALRSLLMPWAGLPRPLGSYCRIVNGDIHKARISAVLDVNGEELEVERTITPARDQDVAGLLASGAMPKATSKAKALYRGVAYSGVKGVESVDGLLASVVGIRNDTQASSVFVMQNQGGGIWRAENAARIRMFQALSGAEVMEKLHKVVTQKLDFFKTADYTARLDEAERDVSRLRDEIAGIEEKLASLPPPDAASVQEAQNRLAAHNHAVAVESSRASDESRLREVMRKIAASQAAVDALVKEGADNGYDAADRPRQHEDAASLRAELAAADARREAELMHESRVAHIRGNIDKLVAAQAAAPAHEPPETLAASLEEANKSLASISLNGKNIRTFLDTYAAERRCPTCKSTGVCPQCGHVMLDIAGTVVEKQRERDELSVEYKRVHALVQDLIPREIRAREAANLFKAREASIAQFREQLAELEAYPRPAGKSEAEIAELRARAAALASMIERCEGWHSRYADAVRALESHRSDADVINAGLSGTASVAAGKLADADRKACEALIERANAEAQQRAGFAGALKAYRDQLAAAEMRRLDLEAKHAESRKTADAAALLQEIRTATHPGSIPRETAAAYLEKVNIHLGVYCQELRLPFTLYVEPERMTLMLQSETMHAPAEMVWSGGLFTMISWAWHLTLYAMHGSNVGLMVIDEMTTGLDADNMECVAEVMRAMGEYCKGTGLQLLFVSHDAGLAGVADHVVDLKPAEPAAGKRGAKAPRKGKK
jgi:DNA repair exonuclease SbcCD ATPase subunit